LALACPGPSLSLRPRRRHRFWRHRQHGEVLAGGAPLLVECRCPALRRFQVLGPLTGHGRAREGRDVMWNITMLALVLGALLPAGIPATVILLAKVGRLAWQVAEFPRREAEIRSDARKRSRVVHMASISEQLAPLLPGFRYNPKDVQWIGGGGAVDAIVWNG